MKFNKKNFLTAGLAVVLAATMMIGGGTFAYLQGQTEDIENVFNTNKVIVELTETGTDANGIKEYEIIPGMMGVSKDPTVKVTASVDAYVFVEVNDATDDLIKWSIDLNWKKLDGYEHIYYQYVTANEAEQSFAVIKDNVISYDAALTNENMLNADGTLKEGLALTFKAYAIQAQPFADAAAAFAAKDATFVASADDFIDALANNAPIVLNGDVTVSADNNTLAQFADKAINLNGNTLTVNDAPMGIALENSSLIIENGTFIWNGNAEVIVGMQAGSELTLNKVNLTTNATINVEPGSEPAVMNIIDSTIYSTDYYCVSTNAANNLTGKTVEINIENSTLTVEDGYDGNGDCTGILFNIPGTLNITNSTVTGDRHAVIIRCGDAAIKDSILTCTVKCPEAWIDIYDNADWGSGNEVPVATLVVGNRSNINSYPYDASCTLENTTLNIPEESGRTVIYAAAYNGHTTTISNGGDYSAISVDSDDNSNIIVK